MKRRFLSVFVLLPISAAIGMAQSASDESTIRRIYDEVLTASPAYEQLREFTTRYGGRLSGSSWDVAPGAHDDGAGVVQSLEVLRVFQALGLKPRHTLRAVWYRAAQMNAPANPVEEFSTREYGPNAAL